MEITAKRIASQPPSADTASTWLDRHLVSWTRMASSNWAEKYPYRPEVKFRIAHTGSHFVIQFDVEETSIRAVALHDNGRVRFPLVNPESDSVASHLARYITASYLMIHELARELTRAHTALAATLVTSRSSTTPSSLGFTPYIPVSSSSPISLVTPPSSTGISAVNPLRTPAE